MKLKFLMLAIGLLLASISFGQKQHTPQCKYYNPNKIAKVDAPLCKICHKDQIALNEPNSTCGALTKAGTPCKRRVKVAGTRCPQHGSLASK